MSNNTIELVVQRLSSADSGAFPSDIPINHKPQERAATDISLLDVKVKVEAAAQLRDNLEHYITGAIYPGFLKKLMPIFINCLKGPPVFTSTSPEQVSTTVLVDKNMLISGPETPELRPRNPAPPAYEPPRTLRTVCRGGCGAFDEPGEN
jgi:transformation/transcription domain-associated protein